MLTNDFTGKFAILTLYQTLSQDFTKFEKFQFLVNQIINQPTKQPTKQPSNEPSNQPANQFNSIYLVPMYRYNII